MASMAKSEEPSPLRLYDILELGVEGSSMSLAFIESMREPEAMFSAMTFVYIGWRNQITNVTFLSDIQSVEQKNSTVQT